MEQSTAVERRSRMRAGSIMLVALLLAACAGAPDDTPWPTVTTPSGPAASELPGRSPSPAPSGAPAPTGGGGAGWRELAGGLWLDDTPFAVAAATDRAQLEQLWDRLGQPPPAPDVEFESEIVLFLGMSGSSSCPERLERLFVDHAAATVHGGWAAPDRDRACTDDLQAQGVLLAVDRSLLPETPFVLSLRGAPICPDCPDRPDQVVVDA